MAWNSAFPCHKAAAVHSVSLRFVRRLLQGKVESHGITVNAMEVLDTVEETPRADRAHCHLLSAGIKKNWNPDI